MKTEKFAIRIESIDGLFIAYLSDRNKTAWTLKTALNKAHSYWHDNQHLKVVVESDNVDTPKAIMIKV